MDHSEMTPEERRKIAENAFLEGYNCAQAVVLAFSDLLPLEKEKALALSSSFGGGMGRLREVCGAVSGMALVLGLLRGYATPETGEVKAEHYRRIQEVAGAFEEKHGTLVCRELLGLHVKHEEAVPTPRTKDFYEKRPCGGFIGDAAEILGRYLEEHPEA